MAANKLSMKLLVDKKVNRVLFAEAGKDVIDFLFSLLSLPIGSVIKLLTKSKMVGSIANLYQSVENLDDTYVLQPSINKGLLLHPKVPVSSPINVPLLTPNQSSRNSQSQTFYICGSGTNNLYGERTPHYYVTNDSTNKCPACSSSMTHQLTYVASSGAPAACGSQNGYVKEVVTFMVMDDLSVMPMSTISSITLLNKFNVENVNLLEELDVDFGMDKGLELLEASLHAKYVLSHVFLGGRAE